MTECTEEQLKVMMAFVHKMQKHLTFMSKTLKVKLHLSNDLDK